ncbi:unnamed protein product [Rotaria magnacalcarata]|nr:unnamed protein product [Rotaria magnacalcarata]
MMYAEKSFYKKEICPFINTELLPLLTERLLEFVYNNNTDNDNAWDTLEIDAPETSNDLLFKVIKVTNSFNSFIKQEEAIDNLVDNIESNILVEKLINEKNKQQFKASKDLKTQEFIEQQIKHFVHNVYNKKHVKDVYSDLQKYGIKIPHEFLQFYKNFSNAEIVSARNIFIKNSVEEKQSFYGINFALEIINMKNAEINSELIEYRPKEVFTKDFSSNLVDFLLDHRILRSKFKELGIKHEEARITHNKKLPIDRTNEEITIYSTGARSDLRFLHGSDSYKEIVKILASSGIDPKDLTAYIRDIIQGNLDFKTAKVLTHDNKVYLYKLADLLFNLETERNVSAFLTNAIFFNLLEKGVYTIKDLVDKLPMAMGGAVDASRSTQSQLPLKKYHKFDFKKEDIYINNNVIIFNLKNIVLMLDWLDINSTSITQLLNFITGMQQYSFSYEGKKLMSVKKIEEDFCDHLSKIFERYKLGEDINNSLTELFAEYSKYLGLNTNKALDKLVENEVYTTLSSINFKLINKPINALLKTWYGIDLSYLDENFKSSEQSKIENFITTNKFTTKSIEPFENKDNSKKLIKENALGDDRNLADHGDNAHYWYSIADGVRLLSWIRKQYITYTNIASEEEKYISHRENNNRAFITDPYYSGNFDNYLHDDISRITEGIVEGKGFADKKWSSMPTAIIIPLLSGLHWRTVCIAIDYDTKTAKILLDDPYGARRFPEDLKNNTVNAIKVHVEKLIQVQTGDPTFKLLDDNIAVQEKMEDQQGSGENGWDCGAITFSNIEDYVKYITEKTQELIYSIIPYKDRNEKIIEEVRIRDIKRYSEIAELPPISQERIDAIKEQLQKSRLAEIDEIRKLNTTINYDVLDPIYVDMLFTVLENTRLLGISSKIGDYTESEISYAYQVGLTEIKAFTNLKNKNVINKSKSSKVNNIFEQFQNLSEKEQEEFLKKLKNTALKGLDKEEDLDIGWINSYFGKYTLDGLDNILDLRIKDLKLNSVKTLQGIFIDQELNNIRELLSDIINAKEQTVLVPINLFNKHAAGLIFDRTNDGLIQVKYLDPENKSLPDQLVQTLSKYNLHIEQLKVEQQKYANCGVEVIENFIFYLTNERLSQEQAIPYHSYLLEQSLMYDNYEEMQLVGCGL